MASVALEEPSLHSALPLQTSARQFLVLLLPQQGRGPWILRRTSGAGKARGPCAAGALEECLLCASPFMTSLPQGAAAATATVMLLPVVVMMPQLLLACMHLVRRALEEELGQPLVVEAEALEQQQVLLVQEQGHLAQEQGPCLLHWMRQQT